MTKIERDAGAVDPARILDHEAKLACGERLAALDALDVTTPEDDPVHDRIVRLASRVLRAPVSLVSYVDTDRQHFKAQEGLCGWAADERGTPLSHSFCQYVVTSEEPLVVRDARQDPVLSLNGAVSALDVVAYLGVPIHAPGGAILGSLCVIDDKPRDWEQDDLDALHDLAGLLETELALRHTANERSLVLQEMNHRIKNLFSLINGLIRMERAGSDTAEDLAEKVSKRIDALNMAHQLIVPVVEAGSHNATAMTFENLLAKLLGPHSGHGRVRCSGDAVEIGPKAIVYVALAIHELATNSAKYGALSSPEGRLALDWRTRGGTLEVIWRETGLQWQDQPKDGAGFGSRLLKISVEGQLGGHLTTDVTPESFTHTLSMPLGGLAA